MRLTNLRARLDDPEVGVLLVAGTGSPASAARAADNYRAGRWRLLGVEESGTVVSCVGAEAGSGDEVVLHNLAVALPHRGRGIARTMIHEIQSRFPGAALVAETDADGVGFYRRCGFAVEGLGEIHPGTKRFRCTLAPADERPDRP